MKKPIIEIKNLIKKFKGRIILDNISLKVFEGEILGLFGPNGAGKTTLIQILLGTVSQDKGTVKLFGTFINNKNRSSIYQKINSASSFLNLQGQITPFENLITFARLYGVKNSHRQVEKLLKFFDLNKQQILRRKSSYLSSGEKIRLLLCKAFINNPKILFLDEPTNNLDPKISEKMINYVLRLHKKYNTTVIYGSHNLKELIKISQRLCFIKDGQIILMPKNKDPKKLMRLY